MKGYIPRLLESAVRQSIKEYPVQIVTGPRQSGKTTMCRHLMPDYKFVNLERLTDRRYAQDDPAAFLKSLGPKAIIDEVQNVPELLSEIQASVDEDPDLSYILTGSCNFALMNRVSQSLAGRASVFTLLPLSLHEITGHCDEISTDQIEYTGFYPGCMIGGIRPERFYSNYYQTYIERDVRELMQIKNLDKFDIFIRLLAGRAGTELNVSSLAVETGVTVKTVNEWLSILKASYIVFELRPYFVNINKRLTKTPKIYFYDSGLMVHLLGVQSESQLSTHPLRGAVFENMVISEFLKQRYNQALAPNIHFYRENSGREVDIVSIHPEGLDLYEVKAAATYRSDFRRNMEYLATVLPNVRSTHVIYDGASIPPAILNFRRI